MDFIPTMFIIGVAYLVYKFNSVSFEDVKNANKIVENTESTTVNFTKKDLDDMNISLNDLELAIDEK